MNKTTYDARLEALQFASLLQPGDAHTLISSAKDIEDYLTGKVSDPPMNTASEIRDSGRAINAN